MQRQGLPGGEGDEVIRAQEAAVLLDVAPEQLGVWSDRCGWPLSEPGGGYRVAEITALADALENCVSISAAIARARRETGARSLARRRRPGRGGARALRVLAR